MVRWGRRSAIASVAAGSAITTKTPRAFPALDGAVERVAVPGDLTGGERDPAGGPGPGPVHCGLAAPVNST